jgi:hypothetical protein
MLQRVGWVNFLMSFRGHNLGVARDIAHNFDVRIARVGEIEIQFNEAIIAEATYLARSREKWYKKLPVKISQGSNSWCRPRPNTIQKVCPSVKLKGMARFGFHH